MLFELLGIFFLAIFVPVSVYVILGQFIKLYWL